MGKSILSFDDRNNIISALLNSSIVGPDTDAKRVILLTEEIGHYIKSGEYNI